MGNTRKETRIENENLFRALVCAPFGVMFMLFAVNIMMSTGLVLFKVIFVLLAMYFSISALAYAAYYTNDLYVKNTDTIKNRNLFNALFNAPLAIAFVFIAANSVMSSDHAVFKVLTILLAMYFALKTLAHAAYYTNEYHESKLDITH